MDDYDMPKDIILPFIAIWHAHFEAIHPFISGNGRIGRILLQLQMMVPGRNPIYLSSYIKEHRYDYYAALESAQKKRNYIPIIYFLCQAIIASYEEDAITKGVIEDLLQNWLVRGRLRKNSSAEKAFYMLISSPVITTELLSEKLGVSFQAASVAIKQLEESRIIRKVIGDKRSRVFIAEEIRCLSARRFGESPSVSLKEARKILGI